MERRFPLNLQFFAEEPDGGQQEAESSAAGNHEARRQAAREQRQNDPEALVDTLIKAIENRSQRAERSTVRSMAEQYGMQESELTQLLEKAKAEKAKALPEEARRQIEAATEKANSLLMAAEVKSIGAGMGLLDAETALLLLDKSKVKVEEGGKVTGVKEALDALKTGKPFLFGRAGAMAQKQGATSVETMSGVEEAFYRRNPGLKER